MDFPYFEIEFTRDGDAFQPAQVDAAVAAIGGGPVTDALILSHGWNNDIADARDLYQRLLKSVTDVRAAGLVSGVSNRSLAVIGVFWPSKKFTDEELIPGGGASVAAPQNAAALGRLLDELKNDPVRLGQPARDPERVATLEQAKALIPSLEADPASRRQFVQLLRSIVDPSLAHPEDGSDAFFTTDPETLFAELAKPVVAPGAVTGGGAAGLGGGAAGVGDLFSGVVGAARRLANLTTYYQMKQRAGLVGGRGVAPVVRRLRQAKPAIKIHLAGHSFGGRVVTAAAAALDPDTPGVTMTLLQAAFSHNGFAAKFDGTNDGFFRSVVATRRIAGPIVITHTRNDKAVGIAYPLAARVAHDKAAALGDANDPYGGMGRNGAQKTSEVVASPNQLLDLGDVADHPYEFRPGGIYNLNADRFIAGHSDICGHQVACALLAAIGAS